MLTYPYTSAHVAVAYMYAGARMSGPGPGTEGYKCEKELGEIFLTVKRVIANFSTLQRLKLSSLDLSCK